MLKKFFTVCVFLSPFLAYSQYKWDFGVSIGAANYLGEMGGNADTRKNFISDLKLSQTKPSIGGFVRMKMGPNLSLKTGVTWARISGADSLSLNRGRAGRNLSFRNDIIEFTLTGEYNIYAANDVARWNRKRVDFRSYAFAGIGGFYHNPKANYQGQWVALRPLHTEGQTVFEDRKEYKKINLCVPVGIGFNYVYGKKIKFGLDIGWRVTFTDYLDDVSSTYVDPDLIGNGTAAALANRRGETNSKNAASPENYVPGEKRGDPTHNDNYFIAGIHASYSIRGKNTFYKSKYNYITGAKRKWKKRRSRAKF